MPIATNNAKYYDINDPASMTQMAKDVAAGNLEHPALSKPWPQTEYEKLKSQHTELKAKTKQITDNTAKIHKTLADTRAKTESLKLELAEAKAKRAESAKNATLGMNGIKPKAAGSPEQVDKRSLIPAPKPAANTLASNYMVMELINKQNEANRKRFNR
ncbi:MAG: hypothetical protein WA173_14240 [Pseudomonas sp.]|uniref:hypothetical protein n=1 Tax=Pseudomonas sp. TaxID=306 RepID=UPI003BB67A27